MAKGKKSNNKLLYGAIIVLAIAVVYFGFIRNRTKKGIDTPTPATAVTKPSPASPLSDGVEYPPLSVNTLPPPGPPMGMSAHSGCSSCGK